MAYIVRSKGRLVEEHLFGMHNGLCVWVWIHLRVQNAWIQNRQQLQQHCVLYWRKRDTSQRHSPFQIWTDFKVSKQHGWMCSWFQKVSLEQQITDSRKRRLEKKRSIHFKRSSTAVFFCFAKDDRIKRRRPITTTTTTSLNKVDGMLNKNSNLKLF